MVFQTDQGLTKAKCYRASCPSNGRVFLYQGTYTPALPRKKQTQREPLSATHRQWLVGRVGAECLRRLHAFSGDSRIGLPVYSPLGEDKGATLRAIEGNPKYISEVDDGYNLGSWYGQPAAEVIAVEDQLSACYTTVHTAKRTVALLGHTVHADLVSYINTNNISLKLALDADAVHLAAKQIMQLRAYIDIDILLIPDDLKNLSVDKLREVVL